MVRVLSSFLRLTLRYFRWKQSLTSMFSKSSKMNVVRGYFYVVSCSLYWTAYRWRVCFDSHSAVGKVSWFRPQAWIGKLGYVDSFWLGALPPLSTAEALRLLVGVPLPERENSVKSCRDGSRYMATVETHQVWQSDKVYFSLEYWTSVGLLLTEKKTTVQSHFTKWSLKDFSKPADHSSAS